MPTGYTAPVEDGTTTSFRDFALDCARAFVTREGPIPDDGFKPHTEYQDRELSKLRTLLDTLVNSPDDAIQRLRDHEYDQAVERWGESEGRHAAIIKRYETMLTAVRAWQPPTDEHEGLKKFMDEQLSESIKTTYSWDRPAEPVPIAQWREDKIVATRKSISYNEKALAEELERVNQRNRWVATLRDSLPQEDTR